MGTGLHDPRLRGPPSAVTRNSYKLRGANSLDILTILPPILALIIAVVTRNVFYALGGAIWASETIIADGNPFLGLLASVDRAASVFESAGNTRILLC